MDLLQKMVSGTPQFVRCIKPNDVKASKCFEASKVIKQLRYTGVLETIRIRQHGFSHRLLFSDFLKRYCFLAYAFDERVVANRESCRLLLIRLKMDGWALGKSKVFLKYYHVEFLSKLYEDQVKKIILVQAFVRKWLAKRRFKKLQLEKESNVLTLQRHVRGWLTRRRFQLLRDKQIREKIEIERRLELERRVELERKQKHEKNNSNVMQQFVSRSALLRKLSSQEEVQNKENQAAVVIQTCKFSRSTFSHAFLTIFHSTDFRGYTLRKQKFSPENEAKIKIILNTAKTRSEAQKMLLKEKFKEEDVVRIIQKYFRRGSRENLAPSERSQSRSRVTTPSSSGSPSKKSSSRDQQVELVGFAQNIHLANQEVHKNLRLNKPGVPSHLIGELPHDYRRPPGFSLIPSLLGSNHYVLNLIKANSKSQHGLQQYDEHSHSR